MNLSAALQMGLSSFPDSKATIDILTSSINEWEFWKPERKSPFRRRDVERTLHSDTQTFYTVGKNTIQLKTVYDLSQKPALVMKAHYGLVGFSADQQTIKLDSTHIIKKFPISEIHEYYSRALKDGKEYLLSEYSKSQYFLVHHYQKPASAKGGIPDIEIREQSRFISFLRLLCKESIEMPFCQYFAKEGSSGNYHSFGMLLFHVKDFHKGNMLDNYNLSKSNMPIVRNLWKGYSNINFDKNKAFSVVIRRFNFSYQRVDWEDQIIDLMIAMEALFLSDNFELKHRLATRVSYFLKEIFPPKEIHTFMKQIYNLRSKVVHGDTILPKDIGANNMKANEIAIIKESYIKDLRDVLRTSIRLYINLHAELLIKDFIKKIDDEMISSFGSDNTT